MHNLPLNETRTIVDIQYIISDVLNGLRLNNRWDRQRFRRIMKHPNSFTYISADVKDPSESDYLIFGFRSEKVLDPNDLPGMGIVLPKRSEFTSEIFEWIKDHHQDPVVKEIDSNQAALALSSVL